MPSRFPPKIADASFAFSTTSIIVFITYWFSAAPKITLMDAGDFIMGAQTLGIVHPPGYPLFTLLGYGASKLFWYLDPASQINLLTAAMGALAAGVLALIIHGFLKEKLLAVFGGLTFALTSNCWSLGVTTEVYSLNVLLINLMWLLAIRYRTSPAPRTFYALSLTTGLALSNCYPLVLLSGLGMVFVIPLNSLPRPKDWLKALAFLVLGLAPYLYLFIQSQRLSQIEYVFFDLNGFEKVFGYILRSGYAALDQKSSSLIDKIDAVRLFIVFLIQDFALASAFVGVGLYTAVKSRFYLRWPLFIALFTSSVLLLIMMGVTPDLDSFTQFYVYTLPTIAYLAIFAALGLKALVSYFSCKPPVVRAVCVLCLLTQAALSFSSSSHHNNDAVEFWGTELLDSLPKDSILIFCADDAFPLQYLQVVKGLRKDVTMYSTFFGDGKPFLYRRGPMIMQSLYQGLTLAGLLETVHAPIFATNCNRKYAAAGHNVILKGWVYQIVGKNSGEQQGIVASAEYLRRVLDRIMNTYPHHDHWMKRLRHRYAARLLSYSFHQRSISLGEMSEFLERYGLEKDQAFLGSLASELAISNESDVALGFFRKIGFDNLNDIEIDDVSILCRLLLIHKAFDEAQNVCLLPEEKSRFCNSDAKLNLGFAYWNQKEKALQYLKAAAQCAPASIPIRQWLEQRDKLP